MFENTTLYISVLLGGLLISALGTAQTIYLQKEEFQIKAAIRDFFLGAIMVTFLYQLVPDSVTNVGSFLTEIKLPSFPMTSGGDVKPQINPDFDLQVGVPRF
jgi:hypothetical protein